MIRIARVVFCICAGVAIAGGAARAQTFKVVDLGALAPNADSEAFSINNAGEVTGWARNQGQKQAVVWRNITGQPIMTALWTAGQNSIGYSLDATGRIVGWANGFGEQFPSTNLAFPNTESRAYDINSRDLVVGWSYIPGAGGSQQHAVIFNDGRPITGGPIVAPFDLGSFGTANSLAYAINDRFHIAGAAAIASGPSHAFFHTTGANPLNQATDDLGTLGGTNSAACCVNATDLVAGWSDIACPIMTGPLNGGQVTHAVLWQPATRSRRDLGTEPPEPRLPMQVRDMTGHLQMVYWARTRERGPDSDGGRAMNNRLVAKQPSPQIVGYSELHYGPPPPKGWNKHCVLYDTSFRIAFMFDGTMHNLNDMIAPNSGWFLQEAWGINDRGQIVGHGYIHGASHAFALLP